MPTYRVYYDATLSFSDSVFIEAENEAAAEALIQVALAHEPPDVSHLGPEHLGDVTVTSVDEEDETP